MSNTLNCPIICDSLWFKIHCNFKIVNDFWCVYERKMIIKVWFLNLFILYLMCSSWDDLKYISFSVNLWTPLIMHFGILLLLNGMNQTRRSLWNTFYGAKLFCPWYSLSNTCMNSLWSKQVLHLTKF